MDMMPGKKGISLNCEQVSISSMLLLEISISKMAFEKWQFTGLYLTLIRLPD
jgi:hypothetical protein